MCAISSKTWANVAWPRPASGVEGCAEMRMAVDQQRIEDALYIGRAPSVGHERQLLNLLGLGLMVNGIAMLHHRRRLEHPPTHLAAQIAVHHESNGVRTRRRSRSGGILIGHQAGRAST
jgi:hypothetical protein